MAARATDGLEKRNKEIMNLKLEFCTLADEKEGVRNSETSEPAPLAQERVVILNIN